MSLFKRISDNVRANLNAMLDKAEDPIKMLNQYLLDMEEDINDAENAVAKQMAVVKRLLMQQEEAEAMVRKREEQALEALRQEREDLARKALMDKKKNHERAAEFKDLYEKSFFEGERLKAQLREMKEEYERLIDKRTVLLARYQVAQANKTVQEVRGLTRRSDARQGLNKMEDKVLQIEAEAQVASELSNMEANLEHELDQLGQEDLNREMDRLKARLAVKKQG